MKLPRELLNLLTLWEKSTRMEREEGMIYYPRQQGRLFERAKLSKLLLLYQTAGAFAALSPNQSEKQTYNCLDKCILIRRGELPLDTPIPAYGRNKIKALQILASSAEDPLTILRGNKVRAFYSNTLDPTGSTEVTIDGHMKNVWRGKLAPLKSHFADVSDAEYRLIAGDFRRAAFLVAVPTPAFQATLWLTHKRVNGILWNAQIPLEF